MSSKTAAKPAAAKAASPSKAPAAKAPAKPVVAAPETLLKKRNRDARISAEKVAKAAAAKKTNLAKKKTIFRAAEKYVKEYRSTERNLIRLKRQAKKAGNFYVEPEAKLAIVTRIRGINHVPPRVRKVLQLLRLRQLHNTVFIKLNKATMNMLTLVGPYIAYGYPNLKTVRELLYKRGFGKVNKNRIPLSDNKVIEDNLGKYGIICMEDLIHEIITVGPNFKVANNFLWPFKLSAPLKGFSGQKRRGYLEGGDWGNRELLINDLIQRMN